MSDEIVPWEGKVEGEVVKPLTLTITVDASAMKVALARAKEGLRTYYQQPREVSPIEAARLDDGAIDGECDG